MTRRILKFAASFELVLAAALWGFGFVAVIWSLRAWNPAQLIFLRYLLGAFVGFAVALPVAKPKMPEILWMLRASFLPAFLLCAMLFLQTTGLRYTTATKSGMITILYVVIVPLFEAVFARKKIPAPLWLCIGISLTGVYFIVQPHWDSAWNFGDLLTFFCAFAAAFQIIAIDRVSGSVKHVFLFNAFLSLWGCLLAACVLPLQPGPVFLSQAPMLAWIGLFSLGLGSTLIAFYLQVKAQKVLSPTVSSLFFLLESPFALLFAFFFLGERLSEWQGAGALLIMLSAFAATLLSKYASPASSREPGEETNVVTQASQSVS